MKRIVRHSWVLMVFLVLLPAAAYAELAKEGSGDYRSGRTAEISMLKMGKRYIQINFDETGVVVGGEGECAGITGTMELKSGPRAKSSKKGYSMGTSIGTVHWKIP
jgi:hypothetical protein